MTAFKIGQRVRQKLVRCRDYKCGILAMGLLPSPPLDHGTSCFQGAIVRQVFQDDPETKKPRYLLENGVVITPHGRVDARRVAAYDESQLLDY